MISAKAAVSSNRATTKLQAIASMQVAANAWTIKKKISKGVVYIIKKEQPSKLVLTAT